MDNIIDGLNDDQFDKYIDQLSELVFKKLIERYGPIYPLNFGINKEEILVSELARLNTILAMLEDTEQFEKCAMVQNRIRNVEATLKNMNHDDD
jgi:protein-arginine kinase activator protein McsA